MGQVSGGAEDDERRRADWEPLESFDNRVIRGETVGDGGAQWLQVYPLPA